MLLIDAGKDELADRPELARELGAEVVKVPKAPIPLDMFAGSDASLESARDVAMDFCASLDKALKDGLTDNQKPRVVEALKPLLAQRRGIPLTDIQRTLEQHYEDNGIKEDRVLSSLRMMNQYPGVRQLVPKNTVFCSEAPAAMRVEGAISKNTCGGTSSVFVAFIDAA